MLDNTITLAYDAEGDGSPVDVVIVRDQEYPDRSVYIFPDADAADHNVTFYRTRPKQSGNFKGVQRTREKLTKPVAVDGVDGSTVASAAIVETSTSFPKGMTDAEKIAVLQESLAIQIHAVLRASHFLAGSV